MKLLSVSALLVCTVVMPIIGQSVSGIVTDASGNGLAGIAIETANGSFATSTTAGGAFTLAVTAATYDVNILPPATLAPAQLGAIAVTGAVNVGTVALLPGFALSGTVVDPLGAPVVNGDMNVYREGDGVKLFTPGDNTDAAGAFSVIVPAGTFRVRASPPAGLVLAALEVGGVVVAGPTAMGTLSLIPGFTLTGTILNGATLAPLTGADIDVDDAVSGRRLPTPGDDTSGTGVFSVIVPVGLYHVTVEPPAGTTLVPHRAYNVFVTGPTTLGTVGLETGLIVSGTVRGPGGVPVPGADIDVDTSPGGFRVVVSNDETNASGQFSVVLRAGTYSFAVRPPFASGLVGTKVSSVNVGAATNVGVLNLNAGVAVSGVVTGWNGLGEPFADLDVFDAASGAEIITVGDRTNANGGFALIAPSGGHSLVVETRKGSLSRDQRLNGLIFSGPTTINPTLTAVPVGIYFDTIGLPTVSPGGPLVTNIGLFNPTPSIQTVAASLVIVDPLGGTLVLLPPTNLPIISNTPLLLFGALLPAPPAAPGLLGRRFRYEIRLTEVGTGIPIDCDGFEFIVQ